MIIPRGGEIKLQDMPKSPAHPAAGAGDARQLVEGTAGQKQPCCESGEEQRVNKRELQRPREFCFSKLFHKYDYITVFEYVKFQNIS